MIKIDKTVKKETGYIAFFVLILSILMQAVFLIIRKWDYTVLLGNILSAVTAVLNFLIMGITVQKAVSKDEKGARDLMKLSQTLRMMAIFVIAVAGIMLPCFNTVSVILPLFFPRIAIALRPLAGKHMDDPDSSADDNEQGG